MQPSSSPWPASPTTPGRKIIMGATASQLLASFSPKPQPVKVFQPVATIQHYPITMSEPSRRNPRRQQPISYEISDDSDSGQASNAGSVFSTPQKRKFTYLEDEIEEVEPAKTPPPRQSSAGHSLRQHSDLHLSLRAQENGDKPIIKRRKTLPTSSFHKKPLQKKVVSQPRTARNEVRDVISTETTARRSKFFIAKKDYFLPLLPEGNHVQRLVDQHLQDDDVEELGVPYEALSTQPLGVRATMKPYQLSGLSFLMYLHRNGLSGILGDEMGLGKTLQTLSLIQYLKENRKVSGTSINRPSLVVCPLSVLSSWMAEARRWTPDLKVLRFHGPVRERERLKRVATGEEDLYGNQTRQARQKINSRRIAKGKEIIDLDEDELAIDNRSVDIVVTTYEGFAAEQGWFKKAFVWSYVILDEGHKIKNDISQISRSLQGLGAEFRLILTGTPLQNNMSELWALLHWLYPEVFTERTAELFKTSFDLSKGTVNTEVLDNARRLLELIMLRRMKNSPGVELNLPPKTDVLLYVPLTPMQRFWYTRLLTRADQGLLEELFQGAQSKEAKVLDDEKQDQVTKVLENKELGELEALDRGAYNGAAATEWQESKEILRQAIQAEQEDESKKSAWRKLMNLLMQLRKCCNHPYLLPHAEPDPYYLGDHIIHASGKFILLDKIVEELVIKRKEKILIFSGFTRMLDCCEDLLALRGGGGENFKYTRLDGGTARARRNLGIRMFNQEGSNYQVMLISTRAGGLGINLTSASTVVMVDQDWNPQIMLQAEARAHRIGQTKPVTVYKLCTQGTVEEQMMGRIRKKLYLSAKVTESMRDVHTPAKLKKGPGGKVVAAVDDDMPQLDTGQLMSLVRRGAQALAHPELDVNEMLNWDWATMLDKCKDRPAAIHSSEEAYADTTAKEEDEKKWLSQMEVVESRVFQGKTYNKSKDMGSYGDISREWTREERRVGKNTTVMVDGFAVDKESMLCGDWEAVPTLAGKDPRLAEPKREKKPEVVNQEHCQACWDGGDLVLCSGCPRSYHYQCLDRDFKVKSKAKIGFSCPQHQCFDCQQKTTDAGGMLFRCRWCERGYCEDCLDWDKTELIGENLKEYELLGFPAVTQAFYISCPSCANYHEDNQEARDFCAQQAAYIDAEYLKQVEQQESLAAATEEAKKDLLQSSRAASLTDATTLNDSEVATPNVEPVDLATSSAKSKRKAAPETFKISPTKRSKRLTV